MIILLQHAANLVIVWTLSSKMVIFIAQFIKLSLQLFFFGTLTIDDDHIYLLKDLHYIIRFKQEFMNFLVDIG